MSSDIPIRLAKAASMRGVAVSALRSEARRGRLTIWRVGGKDYTSLDEIDRMFQKCALVPKESICGSELPAEMALAALSETRAGTLKIEDAKLALDAALMRAQRLKESSRPIYKNFTSQPVENVHYLKSKSRT
jgi:hypothetical protein